MKVSFDIPQPMFRAGDMVKLTKIHGRSDPDFFVAYVCILSVKMSGKWQWVNGKISPSIPSIEYVYVYQEGSKDVTGEYIRPGTIGVSDFDIERGEKISWDKPIVSMDTDDNIKQRKLAWKEKHQ